jgi:hypothetical protein
MENEEENDYLKLQAEDFNLKGGLLNRVEILDVDVKTVDLKKFLEKLGMVKRKNKQAGADE